MYQYNPNLHVKIWLSNNPNLFMNLENRVRLIEMREKNPLDKIHFIFDSTLLTHESINALYEFCTENSIIPIDANTIEEQLESEREKKLYRFYKDEIHNLKSGGNLAVASDILRWLSPIFKHGTYTDFDFPIDTTRLPDILDIEAPILLNIGSLKIGKKEFILANNDFIAIIDSNAAAKDIERVQNGILDKLTQYDTDFVESTESELNADRFLNRHLLKFMKNHSDSLYIAKSKEVNTLKTPNSSLKIRAYINEVMTDKNKFLNFNKISPTESYEGVIKRLRENLQAQLSLIKFVFFNKEYSLIKRVLEQNDEQFLSYLMEKERDLYLKSIVVCTTGPIEVSKALFDGYVVDTAKFRKEVQPLSFNHYGLQKAFRSQNSIPLHENLFGMLKFLGEDNGKLNDSSWLYSGSQLQASRIKLLSARQKELALSLPESFTTIKNDIEEYLQKASKNFLNKIFFKTRNKEKIKTIELIFSCFNQEENAFDITQFKKVSFNIAQYKKDIYAQKLLEDLERLCHHAVVFSLTKDKKIKLVPISSQSSANYKQHA